LLIGCDACRRAAVDLCSTDKDKVQASDKPAENGSGNQHQTAAEGPGRARLRIEID
jgi:hypothetical protein